MGMVTKQTVPSPETLDRLASELAQRAREIRRQLHQYPETCYEEQKTAAMIREELSRLGIPFEAGVTDAPTATIGHIGDPSLPCVALRADIDGLPILEQNDLPYKSRHPGRMHACGHDGHMASLLGAAAVLKRLESDRQLPVCVKLIFQPAEEGGGGAKRIVNAGALDGRIGPKAQCIFGLHGWPGLSFGTIATRPGPLMAATDNFIATFRGAGAHAAYPHLSRDPIAALGEAIISLQQVVSRESNPVDPVVVTIGKICGGTAANIIPESAMMEGTARTLSQATRAAVRQAIHRRLQAVADANDMELEFTWHEGYPPTINDPEMVKYVEQIVTEHFGEDRFMISPASSMGGEDFAYYLEQIPGCFIHLGLRPSSVMDYPGMHHPRFDFNDDVLPIAIQLLSALAIGAAQQQ